MVNNVKNEIFKIIDELINLSEGVKEGIVKNKELNAAFSLNIKKVYEILDDNSFEYKKFDNWKITNYQTIWIMPREEEKYAKTCKNIQDLILILKEITGYSNIENEKHFKVGDNYEILRYFGKIFSNAKNEILIVDGYIDSNIFDYIEEIGQNININILTSNEFKNNFKKLYLSYPNKNLIAKISTEKVHDRYVILDNKIIYLIGTSFNRMGNKNFSIKKLDSKEIILDLYENFKNSDNINS